MRVSFYRFNDDADDKAVDNSDFFVQEGNTREAVFIYSYQYSW